MAYFAEIQNAIVLQVVSVSNETINNLPFPESELVGVQFLHDLYQNNAEWKQTSYNRNFRKNFAGINYTYDNVLDAFIPPQPYPSWLLNTNTCRWEPPTPCPDDGKIYYWDEATLSWKLYNEN